MTHGFDGPVNVTLDVGGASVTMAEERVYTAKQGDSWRIPKGFRTDFATIPTVLSWAVAKLGLWTLAAIVHDLLCEGLNRWHEATQQWPPAARRIVRDWPALTVDGQCIERPTASAVDADRIFRRIARDHGADPVTAEILYVGVRLGALANPARREGWLRTAPRVIGSGLLLAIPLIPATVLAVAGRGLLALARFVVRLTGR
jgi:hypothetical protein